MLRGMPAAKSSNGAAESNLRMVTIDRLEDGVKGKSQKSEVCFPELGKGCARGCAVLLRGTREFFARVPGSSVVYQTLI